MSGRSLEQCNQTDSIPEMVNSDSTESAHDESQIPLFFNTGEDTATRRNDPVNDIYTLFNENLDLRQKRKSIHQYAAFVW